MVKTNVFSELDKHSDNNMIYNMARKINTNSKYVKRRAKSVTKQAAIHHVLKTYFKEILSTMNTEIARGNECYGGGDSVWCR